MLFARSRPLGAAKNQLLSSRQLQPERCTPTTDFLFNAKRGDVGERVSDDCVFA